MNSVVLTPARLRSSLVRARLMIDPPTKHQSAQFERLCAELRLVGTHPSVTIRQLARALREAGFLSTPFVIHPDQVRRFDYIGRAIGFTGYEVTDHIVQEKLYVLRGKK